MSQKVLQSFFIQVFIKRPARNETRIQRTGRLKMFAWKYPCAEKELRFRHELKLSLVSQASTTQDAATIVRERFRACNIQCSVFHVVHELFVLWVLPWLAEGILTCLFLYTTESIPGSVLTLIQIIRLSICTSFLKVKRPSFFSFLSAGRNEQVIVYMEKS